MQISLKLLIYVFNLKYIYIYIHNLGTFTLILLLENMVQLKKKKVPVSKFLSVQIYASYKLSKYVEKKYYIIAPFPFGLKRINIIIIFIYCILYQIQFL